MLKNSLRKLAPGLIFFTVCLLLGFWWIQTPFAQGLQRFLTVYRVIHADYVDPQAVDFLKLGQSAANGMLQSLDPYSRYMPANDYERYQELTDQAYVGIGVQLERLDGKVWIVLVYPGGPADRAGIVPGTRLLAVGDTEARDQPLGDLTSNIRGPAGGEVRLRLQWPGAEPTEVKLLRGAVSVDSVTRVQRQPDGLGYLRIDQFGDRTGDEFRAALQRLEAEGINALLIDLRNNPGGILDVSKEVAGELLDRDTLIVFTQSRDPKDRHEYRADGRGRVRSYPIAVLINENSASASEIVAGALQDNGKARIFGEKSYGKGSVQTVYSFPNGDGMRQTTALYYLPSGRSIHKVGVMPDEEVKLDHETTVRLSIQERHQGYMSPVEFERIFGFKPELEDTQRQAAEAWLRARMQPQG